MNQIRFESAPLKNERVSHGFFTRIGGISQGVYDSLNCGFGSDDESLNVEANRNIVLNELGAVGSPLITPFQNHTVDVIIADGAWGPKEAPKGDAIVTDTPGLAIGVLTADCAPVLLAEADAGVIGVAHAGWRGALGGVLDNVVEAMIYLGAERSKIAAAIGPCIEVERYEIGDEFKQLVLQENAENERFFVKNEKTNRFHFDLPLFVQNELELKEIAAIDRLSNCTYANESLFFSYRRNFHHSLPDYGRQVSAIVLK